MTTLDLVGLTKLMDLTQGSSNMTVGLIDGPVASDHSDLSYDLIRRIPDDSQVICEHSDSVACLHGTYIATMLSAKRGSNVEGICPGCTLLVRPLFSESGLEDMQLPSAKQEELATAIRDCIEGGARVINLSLAFGRPSSNGEQRLQTALDHALSRGVIVVAAAGNQRSIGSTVITRHPSVIPAAACDHRGRPAAYSTFGKSIGSRGLSASGTRILRPDGDDGPHGTSIAAPFITGAIALLWSIFPKASAQQVRLALTRSVRRRLSIVPPLLDAWSSYQTMLHLT